MRRTYPSDISREQFDLIKDLLVNATKKTHPRKYDLYDIFCAVLYINKEGCTWRGLPHDFPNWTNVRYHYDIWTKPKDNGLSLLDEVMEKLVGAERLYVDRELQTSMLIVDSKTIQNADTAEVKGYDAGKKNPA